MLGYILRRVLYAVPIAIGVTLFVFSLVHLAPGDPLSAVVSPETPPEVVERLKADYGFDKPLAVQYLAWLRRAVTGDLGVSTATGRSVLGELGPAVANTASLAIAAAVVGFSIGSLLGGLAGTFSGTWIDRLATVVSVVGFSIPYYWLGIVLVIVFAVELNVLPAFGMGPDRSAGETWGWAQARHMVLPVVALSVVPIGVVARTVRTCVTETLAMDFVQALRARGLPERRVMLHVTANIAPIVLSVMGLQLGYLLGGSILVETIFAWPGTGFVLNDAIFRRDVPVLQGTILVLSLFFVALNLVVDVLQAAIDPRMKRTS
jgi:peptide/nickel transport system permease protein